MTASCACGLWSLRLYHTDLEEAPGALDSVDDKIMWAWQLLDDKLPNGETWIYCATPRNGWPISEIRHSTTTGLMWADPDEDFDGTGLPLEDPGLLMALHEAIEGALRAVDLARTLLVHYPPKAFRRRTTARRAA